MAYSRYLSAGGQGFVHAMGPFDKVEHLRATEQGATMQSHELFDASSEELRWVSTWGIDQPWCALSSARSHLDWVKLQAEGKVKPKPTLRCLDPQGQAMAPVELPLAFSGASIDPSGRYVVLYSSAQPQRLAQVEPIFEVGEAPQGELFNRNLSVVVDLQTQTQRSLTLDGFGEHIERVTFPSVAPGQTSPSFDAGGASRNLAIYEAPGEIILVDLQAQALGQVAVKLRSGTLARQPRRFYVRPGDGRLATPTLFVADANSDIEQIRLKAHPQKAGALDADYSILASPLGAKDLAFLSLQERAWVAAATRDGLLLIDLQSEQQLQVSQTGELSRLLPYDAADGTKMLLGWAPGGRQVMKIALDDLSSSLGRRPTLYRLDEAIQAVHLTAHDKLAVQGNQTLTMIDLAKDQQTPLAGLGASAQLVYPGQDYLYLVGEARQLEEDMRLTFGRVDLRTLVPETQTLSLPVYGEVKLVSLLNNTKIGLHVRGGRGYGLGLTNANAPALESLQMEWFRD